jgi:hypothetical protein
MLRVCAPAFDGANARVATANSNFSLGDETKINDITIATAAQKYLRRVLQPACGSIYY